MSFGYMWQGFLSILIAHIRERIVFCGCLLSLILLTINCDYNANALEYTNSTSLRINDNVIDRSISSSDGIDYEDYGENIESSVEKSGRSFKNNINSKQNSEVSTATEKDENTTRLDEDDDGAMPTNNEDERNPSEIQKAVCTITAGEVKASAEAVTTKTLKGVCSSAELQLAFGNLETKIFKELESIKLLLLEQLNNKQQEQILTTTETTLLVPAKPLTSTPLIDSLNKIYPTISSGLASQTTKKSQSDNESKNFPKLKFFETSHEKQKPKYKQQSNSRDKEVSKFNNTMLADKDLKIFTYYWRLENFTALIGSDHSVTIDSPRFTIKGKALQLKAYFQHLHRDFLFLQLEYSISMGGKSKSNSGKGIGNGNIMLDMGLSDGVGGSLFKAISSNDQILFKYKISILDQQNLRSSKDLVSQEFHNLEGGFLVPNSALIGTPYIKNDTLLIQLFLYL